MLLRRLTSALVLAGLVVGGVPSAAGHLCVAMQKRMPADHVCHSDEDPPTQTSISAVCCELIPGHAALDTRSTPRAVDNTLLGPAPLAGVLPVRPPLPIVVATQAHPAVARGRPPGDRTKAFSSILRI